MCKTHYYLFVLLFMIVKLIACWKKSWLTQVVTICHTCITLHIVIKTTEWNLGVIWKKCALGTFHACKRTCRLMWKCGKTDATCKQNMTHLSFFFFFWSREPRPLISLRASFDTCWKKSSPTIDQDRGRGALAASNDVFSHTCVVACVGQPGFFDD